MVKYTELADHARDVRDVLIQEATTSCENMVTRILVPLDGSTFSECVIPLVRALAGRTSRVCVDLAHFHSGNAGANTSTFESRLERDERAQMGGYLTTRAEQLRAESRANVTTSLLDGAVVPALDAHVKQTAQTNSDDYARAWWSDLSSKRKCSRRRDQAYLHSSSAGAA